MQTALAVLYCPTRRHVQLYPADTAYSFHQNPYNTSTVTRVCRNDYVINGGSNEVTYGWGPTSLSAAASFSWPNMSVANGLSCQRSEVREAAVVDGLSNTYLVGEKYLDPDYYSTGSDLGDNENAYSGDDLDLVRWGHYDPTTPANNILPRQDRSGLSAPTTFGSAHAAGWNVSFCDGSAKMLSFNIDPLTHHKLACRNDGPSHDPVYGGPIDPIQIR